MADASSSDVDALVAIAGLCEHASDDDADNDSDPDDADADQLLQIASTLSATDSVADEPDHECDVASADGGLGSDDAILGISQQLGREDADNNDEDDALLRVASCLEIPQRPAGPRTRQATLARVRNAASKRQSRTCDGREKGRDRLRCYELCKMCAWWRWVDGGGVWWRSFCLACGGVPFVCVRGTAEVYGRGTPIVLQPFHYSVTSLPFTM